MNRLTEIGFERAGYWKLDDDQLSFDLLRHASQRNILYAFVSDAEVMYVGKTIQTLAKRMHGYKNPAATQTTNVRNNENIRQLLAAGSAVEIYALPDNGLMHYGQFHLNLAAGLEDDIIAVLQPPWNGTGAETPRKIHETDKAFPRKRFPQVIHQTYYDQGFFNVGVDHEDALAGDGEQIEIFCGEAKHPITGYINRRCNRNHTPRVMGGVGLRDWFQEHVEPMDEVEVAVYSPNSIRIEPARSDSLPTDK